MCQQISSPPSCWYCGMYYQDFRAIARVHWYKLSHLRWTGTSGGTRVKHDLEIAGTIFGFFTFYLNCVPGAYNRTGTCEFRCTRLSIGWAWYNCITGPVCYDMCKGAVGTVADCSKKLLQRVCTTRSISTSSCNCGKSARSTKCSTILFRSKGRTNSANSISVTINITNSTTAKHLVH